jgi:transcriptional regulator with XRE-family HTH domain
MSADAQKKLGERIRARRLALGLTQDALAERAGIVSVHLSRIEHGEHDVGVTTIQKIAAALETTPADLLGGTIELSPKARDFAKLFDEAPPEVSAALLVLLHDINQRRSRGQS